MATRKNILLILVVFLSNFSLSAQKNIPIGNWRSHLSYTTGKYIQEFNNKMYCATDYGLFYYGLEEGPTSPGFSQRSIRRIVEHPKA